MTRTMLHRNSFRPAGPRDVPCGNRGAKRAASRWPPCWRLGAGIQTIGRRTARLFDAPAHLGTWPWVQVGGGASGQLHNTAQAVVGQGAQPAKPLRPARPRLERVGMRPTFGTGFQARGVKNSAICRCGHLPTTFPFPNICLARRSVKGCVRSCPRAVPPSPTHGSLGGLIPAPRPGSQAGRSRPRPCVRESGSVGGQLRTHHCSYRLAKHIFGNGKVVGTRRCA